MKKFHFKIREGIYCSSCADMLKKTLKDNFKINDLKIEVMKGEFSFKAGNKQDIRKIICFLKKRGCNFDSFSHKLHL